jgi:predicted Zn-dependent peptidase
MKIKKCWLLAIGCLLAVSCSKYKYEEVKDDPMKTRIYTLDNGLKVYLSVNEEKPRIQTYIAVRTGSKNDPAETTGLAHYLEHLMFKGTGRFGVTDSAAEAPLLADIEQRYEQYRVMTDPKERLQAYHAIDSVSQLAAKYFIPNEYDKMMAAIGAEGTNAFTSYDRTCYVEDIPSNQVETWLKIESDRFKNMVIRGFHTELEAVYEEYNMGLAEDGEKVFDALLAKLFPTHAYGTQTVIGTQQHLKNPSITNIKNYFKKWYVPNNVAICMAGDFDPDEVIALIDQYFGDWQPGEDVAQPEFPKQPEMKQVVDTTVVGLEAEQLLLGWRFDDIASMQTDTLQVFDYLLTNGKAGLVDLDINQQMKMLQAYSTTVMMMDYSLFMMGGTPREGQTLDEVRSLLLAEIEKVKKGDFDDDLLPSVLNNLKLDYFNSMEYNRSRTSMFLNAFIGNIPWEQCVRKHERMAGITKQQMVDFANRHFKDNYVAVYKRQGVDNNQKKIDKPAITPIPTNRDAVSQFAKDIQQTEVKPIEPHFVDFQRDITFGNVREGIPYAYVKNTQNGRFELSFRYEFGVETDVRYDYAADYLDYIGTDSLTAEQVQQQFYKLACSHYVSVGARSITVGLSGLSENMPKALALLEHLLQHAKVDDNAYEQYIAVLDKARADSKLSQENNFYALEQYGVYGLYNGCRHIMTASQLRESNPQDLLDLLKNLGQYEHTVLYYGPLSDKELADVISKNHITSATLKPVPQGKHYAMQLTPQNEVLLAPYDAKNIYMEMFHIEDTPWNADEAAVKAVFDEYYGGSMGSVVFQELREARGLAYSAYAGYADRSYPDQKDYALVYIITQNDKMMDCVRQFHQILDTIPQNAGSFDIAKKAVQKKIASQRYTKFGLISYWLSSKLRGIDYDENERIYKALPDLTLQDVVKFEQSRMAHKPWRYIILGNERELDVKALEKIAPIRRLTTEEIFGY